MNAAPNHITKAPVPDVLDADCTVADLVDTLRRLKFDVDAYSRVWLDRAVRDFLVRVLTERRR